MDKYYKLQGAYVKCLHSIVSCENLDTDNTYCARKNEYPKNDLLCGVKTPCQNYAQNNDFYTDNSICFFNKNCAQKNECPRNSMVCSDQHFPQNEECPIQNTLCGVHALCQNCGQKNESIKMKLLEGVRAPCRTFEQNDGCPRNTSVCGVNAPCHDSCVVKTPQHLFKERSSLMTDEDHYHTTLTSCDNDTTGTSTGFCCSAMDSTVHI